MRRYIVLLLITGIVWAQTDFDKLVLKDGTTYLGEYEKIEGEIVYFKHQDAFGFQPVPVKLIQTLKLKDGRVLLHNGIIKKNKHTLALEEYQNFDEYQKFSTKEKAIYDAKSQDLGNLTIPYLLLNNKEKINFPKSILTVSERRIYEQAYSKKLRQRKNVAGFFIVAGFIVIVEVVGNIQIKFYW